MSLISDGGVQTPTGMMQPCVTSFILGLSEGLKDELAWVGVPSSLEALITLSIQTDHRLQYVNTDLKEPPTFPSGMDLTQDSFPSNPAPRNTAPSAPEAPEPMQLGLICPSLTLEERQRQSSRVRVTHSHNGSRREPIPATATMGLFFGSSFDLGTLCR